MHRVHVTVRGHVQGVGYRYTTRSEAERRGVSGWVRNRRDGSVEAELEGAPDAVEEMVRWMRQGPPGSRVEAVEVADAPAADSPGFEVRATA